MLGNYLKIALRNLLRYRGYNILNLVGLSLGIACSLLLILHTKDELSYEHNFPKYQRIYRMSIEGWAKSAPSMGLLIPNDLPEIRKVARFFHHGSRIVSYGEFRAEESRGYFADTSAFSLFDLQLVKGNPRKAFEAPHKLVISESMAKKYFGEADPIGKTLKFDNKTAYEVTGIIKDMPRNTHLQFDYLVSMPTFYQDTPEKWTSNHGWMAGYTYLLFDSKQGFDQAMRKLPRFLLNYYTGWGTPQEILKNNKLLFMPIADIHLHSNLVQELGPNSDVIYVYIFSAVAAFIILIASVNFINLFTTQAFQRMKEIGMRKMMGARKDQLVAQFLGEAFLMTLLASLVAVGWLLLAVPAYNRLAGKSLSMSQVLNLPNAGIIMAVMVTVGLLSGLYPALFVSGFSPLESIKGTKSPQSATGTLRKGLVVFQFVISVCMLVSTMVVYQQMRYFRDKKLGFDRDQVVAINLYGDFRDQLMTNPTVLKTSFLSNPQVLRVGLSSNLVGDELSVEGVIPDGFPSAKEFPSVKVMRVDEDFPSAMGIRLAVGRNFSRQFNDSASFILNETAVKALELQHPVGHFITNQTRNVHGPIVGVIKDFHFASLHNRIEPLVLEYKPEWTGQLLVKIKGDRVAATLSDVEAKMKAIAPNNLFTYNFLDDKVNAMYRAEHTMSMVFNTFTAFALLIACLGLFGLAAFTAQQRTKEIGIRKVLGATVSNIVSLLSKDFLKLVLIAFVIAAPIAWYGMNRWLEAFAYRISMGWSVFAAAALAAVLIALLTVSYQAIKAAMANPVKSLRTE